MDVIFIGVPHCLLELDESLEYELAAGHLLRFGENAAAWFVMSNEQVQEWLQLIDGRIENLDTVRIKKSMNSQLYKNNI